MKFTSIIFLLLWTGFCYANNWQNDIHQLVQVHEENTNIGISIIDLSSGNSLYSYNDKKYFIPASNMKLFSDAAGLLFLGADFRFQNQISTNAKTIDNGILNGSVYLHLPGDPSFSRASLKDLLTTLKDYNIKNINGDIVIISDNRKIAPYAGDWIKRDLKFDYAAPLAPVILDENRINLIVNPSSISEKEATIELQPRKSGIKAANKILTKKNPSCSVIFDMDENNNLILDGCINIGQPSFKKRIAIKNSLLYTKNIIKQQLQDLDITLNGKINIDNTIKNTILLNSRSSKPLSQLIANTLKTSDNLYADSIFLKTAALIKGSAVNWNGAQDIIKKFLEEQTGIDLKKAKLTDGSGLSRSNSITPLQTVSLLNYLYHKFPLSYEYITALPIAGVDGTLAGRFKEQKGYIRAKTGTMKGIISLSGYLYTANQKTLAFAIYINKKDSKKDLTFKERNLVDEICAMLLKQSINLPPANFNIVKNEFKEQIPSTQIKWRELERDLKKSLIGQATTVLYYNNHLVIKDQNSDMNQVWSTIKQHTKTLPLAIALEANKAPIQSNDDPFLLWIYQGNNDFRTWTIRQKI